MPGDHGGAEQRRSHRIDFERFVLSAPSVGSDALPHLPRSSRFARPIDLAPTASPGSHAPAALRFAPGDPAGAPQQTLHDPMR